MNVKGLEMRVVEGEKEYVRVCGFSMVTNVVGKVLGAPSSEYLANALFQKRKTPKEVTSTETGLPRCNRFEATNLPWGDASSGVEGA